MPAQTKKSTLKTNTPEVTIIQPPFKDLFVWKAPSRPFKKRDKEYFATIAAVVFLLVIILLFLKEWLLIGVIVSFMFFAYVLATVPPQEESYKISTRGVMVADKIYEWDKLSRFWFSKKWDSQLLNFETKLTFPTQLKIILKDITKEEIKSILEKYLTFEKPKKTFADKSGDWLKKTFPLENK